MKKLTAALGQLSEDALEALLVIGIPTLSILGKQDDVERLAFDFELGVEVLASLVDRLVPLVSRHSPMVARSAVECW